MNFFAFWKFLFCFAWMPLFVNGSSKSQSSTASTYNADNRQVNTDSNNTVMSWDNSQGSNNTIITDGGAVSAMAGTVTSMGDTARRAIEAALSLGQSAGAQATAQAVNAYDYSGGIFSSALDFANDTGNRQLEAYERAATMQDDALAVVKGATAGAADLVKAAYADAKGTTDSQKQIMLGVLAVAAVAVLAAIKGK